MRTVGFVVGALAGAVAFAIVWYTALYSEESLHGPAGMMLCAAVAPTTGVLGLAATRFIRR